MTENEENEVALPTRLYIDPACEVCKARMSDTERHIHNYHTHQVQVPIADIDVDTYGTDVSLLYQHQRNEPQFKVIYAQLSGDMPDNYPITKNENRYLNTHEFVLGSDSLLYCIDLPGKRIKSRVRTRLRLCIPKLLRSRILHEMHEGVLSNHPGIIRMYDTMREKVWWPNMLSDVVKFVKLCDICQRAKRQLRPLPVQSMSIPLGPWRRVAVDHVGPLPRTTRGNSYILTCIDVFTRKAEAIAVPDVETITTADAIVTHIVCRYGIFEVLQSDRGSAFTSVLAANIYKQLGIKQIKTSAYHPQSNGVIEIFNKSLKDTLKKWANENQNDWDVLLPFAIFAYNTAFHSTPRNL